MITGKKKKKKKREIGKWAFVQKLYDSALLVNQYTSRSQMGARCQQRCAEGSDEQTFYRRTSRTYNMRHSPGHRFVLVSGRQEFTNRESIVGSKMISINLDFVASSKVDDRKKKYSLDNNASVSVSLWSCGCCISCINSSSKRVVRPC